MKKNVIIILLTCFFIGCYTNQSKNNKLIYKENRDDSCNIETYSYEDLKMFHSRGCIHSRYPLSYKIDLNNDSIEEEFLILNSYGRGGSYILYTKQNIGWLMISDTASININHLGPQINPEINDGWHSFSTFERWDEFKWEWKNGKYILKEIIGPNKLQH